MKAFVLVMLSLYLLIALALALIDRLEALAPQWADLLAFPILISAIVGIILIIVGVQRFIPEIRAKPPGYVGRFRRYDGTIVHVARLFDGKLMVASDTPPGLPAKDLGNVTGRELARWTKLATTPDGDDLIRIEEPRP